ncbi:nicotinate-nucleotide--dimethylbenzimidazole phosphoribosyltransferase [Aestuariicoccus sp. MJ-SS9]|uniref:nicotinate-nucleotide--dimethylbenzimidazole phosphoribosyltransferase n=1 Tax=Aestuariicoccus sp. MJ-SS9 TaxID=3079855 RepID=UPI00290E6A1A|nr:nicotinate-nucleotide--dimethylbenzimidazole phosphoribosyltransferase [Aestuariicoccus sp. MJ-SS9]MDU8911238.1 nicotinate-nucleotide--dimethylbenzimidazole phosphoribosyltransferase [Aestuariicoccus sp. MJ-SS9]
MKDATPPDFEAALRRKIDLKTKPQGALGRIEDLAASIARLQGTLSPRMESCELMLFAADHGIAAEGVSAYPQEVTRQMVLNFAAGGAAACVFARSLGLGLHVVNAGVKGGVFGMEGILDRPVAEGTASFLGGPAMTQVQVDQALATGGALATASTADALAFGEMGIGNTSSAVLIAHKMLGRPVADLVGRGTGLDDAGLARKRAVLERAAARTGDLDALNTLRHYGGFEIAMMAGAMIGAASRRQVVIVDGFIVTAAALLACAMEPAARAAMVFAHASAEPGHRAMTEALEARPLLDLDMRLGEGTGAALAWPLLRAAVDMLNGMASFDDAGVSGPV